MRVRALLLALLLIVIVLPLPTHGDAGDCSGASPIRVAIGVTARTILPDGTPLHANPGERFRQIAMLRSGTALEIVGGPVCSDAMQWWQVRGIDGMRGWLPEGDEAIYQIEPWPISLDIVQRAVNSVRLLRVKATDASGHVVMTFPVKPVAGSVGAVFPPSEVGPLEAAFNTAVAHCPLALKQSDPAYVTEQTVDKLPADTGNLDAYPSPDGIQLLVVRHLWRSVAACSGQPLPVYGIDRLSLITAHADMTVLDIPANTPSPIYLDHFPYQKQEATRIARSRIEGVWWSPDSARVLLSIRYADFSDPKTPVFTYKVVVYNLRAGTLTELGDGRSPSWNVTGDRVQWFRMITDTPGTQPEEILYTANADGTDLRSVPLPAGIKFMPFPSLVAWNALGQRVLGCVQQSDGVCSAVASFDLVTRQLSAPLPLDTVLRNHGYYHVKWINNDALLWFPADPESATLYIQRITKSDLTPFHLRSLAGVHLSIVDAAPFADGRSILVMLRDGGNLPSYLIVNAETDQVMAAKG